MSKSSTLQRYSWQEYNSILKRLYQDTSKYLEKRGLKIDVVIPIMRGGAIPATYLAYNLHVLNILPVHYHYDFRKNKKMKLRQYISIRRYLDLIPEKPNILLVEGNQCFGNTAIAALEDIRENIKEANLLYATDLADYGHKNAVKADATFIGTYTNECGTLSEKQAKNKDIFPSTKLLPWEVEKEEKETIRTKQFRYSDLNQYFTKSKVVKEIDL